MQKLALLGGEPTKFPAEPNPALFHWPIVTEEDEKNVLEIMRQNRYSGTDVTETFEREYAA